MRQSFAMIPRVGDDLNIGVLVHGHDIRGQAIHHGPGLLAGAGVGLVDFDRALLFRLPVLREDLVVVVIELAGDVVGDVQQSRGTCVQRGGERQGENGGEKFHQDGRRPGTFSGPRPLESNGFEVDLCGLRGEQLVLRFFGEGGAEYRSHGATADGDNELAGEFGRFAISSAAQTLAPVEMPARMPSLDGETAGGVDRILVAHGHDVVEDGDVEVVGNEAGSGVPWILWGDQA